MRKRDRATIRTIASVTGHAHHAAGQRLRSRLTDVGQRLLEPVPAWLGGHLHRLPPRLTLGLTGPFNGQHQRQAAVAAMFRAVPFATIIETGTFRGMTTRHLHDLSKAVPIGTIELNPRYFAYSRQRLAPFERIKPFLGHSAQVLAGLSRDPAWRAEPCFFYLDAHWLDDLPLRDELHVIRGGWHDFAALIDDFRVDGDDGYFYDDYGPGKALALPLLVGVAELADLRVFWPSALSGQETGARRGWVVLASEGKVADALNSLSELRSAGPLTDGRAASAQR
jgi:hypothetical protein